VSRPPGRRRGGLETVGPIGPNVAAAIPGRRRGIAALVSSDPGRRRGPLDLVWPVGPEFQCDDTREEERCRRSSFKISREEERRS